jgi:hypothetical protein
MSKSVCEWCEEDADTANVYEHKIKDAEGKRITVTICLGCYSMYDQQMADALDDLKEWRN